MKKVYILLVGCYPIAAFSTMQEACAGRDIMTEKMRQRAASNLPTMAVEYNVMVLDVFEDAKEAYEKF